VGEDIFCRVTGTNGVDNSSADSNSLEVVSAYQGIGDLVTLSAGFATSQPLTTAYSSGGLNSIAYRASGGGTGEIGFVGDKFDSDGWDTASNFGAETLFVSSWLDQIGSDNATEATATAQPTLSRDGLICFDGVNDSLLSDYVLGNGSNFTVFVFSENAVPVNFDTIVSMRVAAQQSWQLEITDVTTTQIELKVYTGGSSNPWRWSVPTYFDGTTDPDLIFTYEQGVGAILYADGIAQTVTRSGGTGVLDHGTAPLRINGYEAAVRPAEDEKTGVAMSETTLTPAEVLAVDTLWKANNV